jgi:hypothetical protein
MSICTEFAADIERRRARLRRQQMWARLRGPVSTETLFWAALFLVALGSLLAGAFVAGMAAGR